MQKDISRHTDLFSRIDSSLEDDDRAENFYEHIIKLKRLLIEKVEYEFHQLKQKIVSLVYNLRAKILKELMGGATKERYCALTDMLFATPSYGVPGHEQFMKKCEKYARY